MEWIQSVFFGETYRMTMTILFIILTVVVIGRYLMMVIESKRFISILNHSREEHQNLNVRIEEINIALNDGNKFKSIFKPNVLQKSWEEYHSDLKSTTEGYVLDPYDYFREDDFVHKYGWRKFVEAIPATFVSLGILGTFIGLIDGMENINTNNDSTGMMEGVDSLLAGMGFAFYSSIAGIILSILFQLLDRTILYHLLTNSLAKVRKTFDETIPVKTEGNLLYDLSRMQEEQMNDFKSFFSDTLIPKLTAGISDSMSQTITDSLTPHLERSNDIMEEVVKNTTEKQSEKMEEMVDSFIQSLHEVNGDHMKNLGDALHKTIEWQEKVHDEMGALVDEMKNVAEKQSDMARNTMDLSEQMNEYTGTLSEYQNGMVSLTEELNGITERNTDLLKEMGQLSGAVTDQQKEAEERLRVQTEEMQSVLANLTEQGSAFSELQQEATRTVEALTHSSTQLENHTESNRLLNDSLISQHEKSNEWSDKTQQLLEGVVENMQVNEQMNDQMNRMLEQISSERESIEGLKDEQLSLMKQSMADLKEYWKENEHLLTENKEQFAAVNEALSNSMDQFADHMQKGVQSTFKQFDTELDSALKHLSRGVDGIRQVIELMERDINDVNGHMDKFNKSISQIAATKQ